VVRAIQVTPPNAKAPRSLGIWEVGVDGQAIDTVVDPIEPGRVMLAEGIGTQQRQHGFGPAPALGLATGLGARRRKNHRRAPASRTAESHGSQENCPAGATFSGQSPGKSVESINITLMLMQVPSKEAVTVYCGNDAPQKRPKPRD